MLPNVYEFHDAAAFLNAFFIAKKRQRATFSLRSWSRNLKGVHAAQLSMILNRKRPLKSPLTEKITETLGLDPQARLYFIALVNYTYAESDLQKEVFLSKMCELAPRRDYALIDDDQKQFLSDWIHIAIMELTYLADFRPDGEWMSDKFFGARSSSTCQEAFDRLVRVGLLHYSEDGTITKTHRNLFYEGMPSEQIRDCQAQFIEKGLHALRNLPPSDREVGCHTIATNKKKIDQAKEMVRNFRYKLGKFLEDDDCDSIMQFNVQLFDLLPGEESHHT